MIIATLVLVGLCLGSFVNALVWRLHQQSKKRKGKKYSISRGRSMCPHCKHQLSAQDLLPLVSWLMLRGKCRYCRHKVSVQYPIVEANTAGLFVLSYAWWPEQLKGIEIIAFMLWLAILVGLMALLVYDLRWMLLPNRIIFPGYVLAVMFVLTRMIAENSTQPALEAIYGVLIGGGIFYLLFQISDGRWIGGGDVKLGFLIGALVGGPANAILLLFIASLLGSLVSVPLLIGKRASRRSQIPFGPFLIVAAIVVMFIGVDIIRWYTDSFLY